jgi:transposase
MQKEENRDPEDAHLLQKLVTEHPQIAEAVELTEGFALLLHQRQAAQFDPWLLKALKSQLKPFKGLPRGYLRTMKLSKQA